MTLTATNEYGSSTKVQEFAVNISEQSTNMAPFFESFEETENLWPFHAENYDNNHTFFSLYTEGGFSGNACAMLNSGARNQLDLIDQTNDLDIDDLVSPSVNLSGLSGVQLSFRYSYSTNTTVIDNVIERLEVDRSLDCGRTWINAAVITGEELVTNGNNPQMPPTAWSLKSVSLPNSTLGPNNRFRFRFISSEFSNNFFIDDINFGTPVGIIDLNGNVVFMNLYPNPTNDHFTLQVTGMEASSTEITITDIRGAVVYQNVYQPTGGALIELSGRGLGLSDGMYLLRAANSAGSSVTKLIVGQ